MRRAASVFSVGLVCPAVEESVRFFAAVDPRVMHGPAAVRALEKPGEDLRRTASLFPTTVVDLHLYSIKDVFGDNRLMRVLDSDPLLRRVANMLLALVGDLRLLIVDGVPDVGLAR